MTYAPSGTAEQRGKIIKLLETAMTLAEDLEDETTAYLIERALDEARAQVFTPESLNAEGRRPRRLCRPTVRDRHAARRSTLCVNAGLGVSFSSAARDHFSILSHDLPVPTGAVLHNANLGHITLL